MTNNIPQLSVGAHEPGSGQFCAMEVVSWENGDTEITDFPDCVDRGLARFVQYLNDTACQHLDERHRLCAQCSVGVLEIAHSVVGTAGKLKHAGKEKLVAAWRAHSEFGLARNRSVFFARALDVYETTTSNLFEHAALQDAIDNYPEDARLNVIRWFIAEWLKHAELDTVQPTQAQPAEPVQQTAGV